MTSEDWANIARCADERVMAQTFSLVMTKTTSLGTCRRARWRWLRPYRETLITSTYVDITVQLAEAFNAKDVLDELGDQPVRSISIVLNTD
jgi:hypothetical protein